MPKRSTRPEILFLREMVDAASSIIELLGDLTPEQLNDDRRTRESILWNFTVLGEASTQLPQAFTASHAEIPWVKASLLRNRIVHGYWNISTRIIRDTAEVNLPGLIESLKAAIQLLEKDGQSAHSPQEIEDQP